MNTDSTFTILSTRAPLVEVDGDGPYYLSPGGVAVADGARTSARVDLASKPIRKFRVETSRRFAKRLGRACRHADGCVLDGTPLCRMPSV